MSKHTAGPWRVMKSEYWDKPPYVAGDEACDFVAEMLGKDGQMDRERMTANAHLIAAAPEMYEALTTVFARVKHTNINTPIGDMQDTWKILADAIAKAEEGR